MKSEEIEKTLLQNLPGAEVKVRDTTGTGDHFDALVVWKGFAGKSLVQQHQLVMDILKTDLHSGALHALALKTRI
ncbi:MAG: BolA/IbaG family iron-sulfur metabolism protein [Deltaproteobacteria bacterium]|nr:BolA/IbaG family iron-sulfur metabolism protein [Deltaproteobacteria bacterium]